MAFEGLSEKLQGVFKNLKGKGSLSEKDINDAMREVKLALLEADVNFKVVKEFVQSVKEKALGEEVMKSLTPAQQVIKIVDREQMCIRDRKNMYRVAETEHNEGKKGYVVVLNDHTTRYLSEKNLNMVLRAGLRIYGYLEDQDVSCITVKMQGRGKKGVY